MTILVGARSKGAQFNQSVQPVNANNGDVSFNTLTGDYKTYDSGISIWRLFNGNSPGWGPGMNYGYNMGGYTSVYFSTVERITFPFDSGTASIVGNLSASKRYVAGCDGTDFVTLFA